MKEEQPPTGTLHEVSIPARDGFALAGSLFRNGGSSGQTVIVNSATAAPHRFYRHFAAALAEAGYTAVTYDYRGIGGSRPPSLRGFAARMRDWAFLDMAGVVDWVTSELAPTRLFLVGHSVGGQVAGMLDNADRIDGMITMSAQSGYWRLQGGSQKLPVAFHVYVTLPLLATLTGFMPWSWVGAGEDLPKGVALEWARWCRDPRYLLGDESLPLDRFERFSAPVLAYSFGDDDWGTRQSVNAMMSAYPNVERRHVEPATAGLASIGHFGYFKPASQPLWREAIEWLDAH
jgi:predicted alpha/beta hydrolase